MRFFNALFCLSLVICMGAPASAQDNSSAPQSVFDDKRVFDDKAPHFIQQFDTRDLWAQLNQTNDALYDYLAQAYQLNPTVFAARAELLTSYEQLVQAKSGYLPQINAHADVTYSNTETDGSSFVSSDGGNVTKSANVVLNQPLYKGGRTTASIDVANNNIAAQQFSLSRTEQSVLLQAVQAYMDLYHNQAILELRRNDQDLVAKELDQAQARFDVGELTITDVSQSKARLAQAMAGVITAQADVRVSEAEFENVIGARPEAKIVYPNLRFDVPSTLDASIEVAMTNNREIVQARFAKQAATARIRTIKGELLPQVDAVTQLNKVYTPTDFIDEQRQAKIGVQASIPLYTGGATKSRIREAKKMVLQNEAQIESLENKVKAQVIGNWERWKAAQAMNIARLSQISATRVAQEGVQYETEFGERTTLDALNANQELLIAQTDLIASKTNEIIAFFTLAESLGLLVPQNLGFEGVAVE